jgi:hypothetical protein
VKKLTAQELVDLLLTTIRNQQQLAILTDTPESWKARALSAEEEIEWWEENHDANWMDQEVCRLRVERDCALALVAAVYAPEYRPEEEGGEA